MIIGVTGSRTWTDREKIAEAFDQTVIDYGNPAYPNVLIVGNAGGADVLGKMEAYSRGWHIAFMVANWDFYGRKAGFVRDQAMVYLGGSASCWLAFINPCNQEGCPDIGMHDSHGAAITVRAAKKAGIEVKEYRDG